MTRVSTDATLHLQTSVRFFFRMKTLQFTVRKDIIGHERQTADCTLSICSD